VSRAARRASRAEGFPRPVTASNLRLRFSTMNINLSAVSLKINRTAPVRFQELG